MSVSDPQHPASLPPGQPPVDQGQTTPPAQSAQTPPHTQGQSLPPQAVGQIPASTVPAGGAVARPMPVQPGMASSQVHHRETTEDLGGEGDLTEVAFKAAPPWLVSALVHVVILIVLALIFLPPLLPGPISLLSEPDIWAEDLGDQLVYDSILAGTDFEAVEEPIDTPEDLPPVEDPFAAPEDLDKVLDGLAASSDVSADVIGMALNGRESGYKSTLLGRFGGTRKTQEAVERGLEWLAKQQRKDGQWSLIGPYPNGGAVDNEPSATAMALLAFQGNGITHKKGRFAKNVAKGWTWLLQEQDADGNFYHEGPYHHRFYTNGQCAIALCEIYGMTKDKKFLEPAERSIDYLLRSQSSEGGWRYSPASDSDVSVTGWIVMALQSARMAGLDVPEDHFRRVERYLDKVSTDGGTRYPYQRGEQATTTMTAEAILCRQYLGWPRDDERMIEAIEWITQPSNLIDFEKDRNVYYWYYATQACHHIEGDAWKTWNGVMRQELPSQQVTRGQDAGSWNPVRPSRDQYEAHGGRLYVTCLSIYMLEVYYRHLPIYSNPFQLLGNF